MSIASTLKRTVMASPPRESRKVLEGIFAINKPQWASSAGVLRDLQEHFATSPVFKPWLDSQRREMILSYAKKRHIEGLKVKTGHGGTLDPMATGVLIVGVGKGTKCLQRFLECTKTYECVVLFGAATDSYDAVGKVVSKAPYEHVTKELVEEKLAQFRGKIMQKPSIFSALKVDGKKMYEYAREGKDIPEVPARPVEVVEMEMVEWLEPNTHEYAWPKEEVDGAEREGAEKLLGIRKEDAEKYAETTLRKHQAQSVKKRSRSPEGDQVLNAGEQPKRPRTDSEPAMSGALPVDDSNTAAPEDSVVQQPAADSAPEASLPSEEKPMEIDKDTESIETREAPAPLEEKSVEKVEEAADMDTTEPISENSTKAAEEVEAKETTEPPIIDTTPRISPPAVRLRMTVTSGFYVRSLCHDLGLACSSLGLMSSLVRSRQGDYTLGQNVLEYSDLEKGPDVWEPKIQKQLEEFMEKEDWEAEEVDDDETWESTKGDLMKRRKEHDRNTSYKGGNKYGGKSKWKGKGGGNYYSKKMNGERGNG